MGDLKDIDKLSEMVTAGTRFNYHGSCCVADKVQYAYGDLYAHLCFSTENERKTGTDGWYCVRSLISDKNVRILPGNIEIYGFNNIENTY